MEGLELSECIYTLRGTRPRRIVFCWGGMGGRILLKALWGGQHHRPSISDRHTSEGGRQNIHAFQDRRMDKDRQSVLQEIWFDTKASDPPRSHGFAHEFSRREKDEKGRHWLFKTLKLKVCFLCGRGAIFLAEK